jgi:hypothetical protein
MPIRGCRIWTENRPVRTGHHSTEANRFTVIDLDFWQCAEEGCHACQILREGITYYAELNDCSTDWRLLTGISV